MNNYYNFNTSVFACTFKDTMGNIKLDIFSKTEYSDFTSFINLLTPLVFLGFWIFFGGLKGGFPQKLLHFFCFCLHRYGYVFKICVWISVFKRKKQFENWIFGCRDIKQKSSLDALYAFSDFWGSKKATVFMENWQLR